MAELELQTLILPILALVLAGLSWTLAGYLKEWRTNHNNPDWTGFDKIKLRNDALLGFVLGIGVTIYTIATEGNFAVIDSAQTFLLAIYAGFPVVVLVDKYIIGGLFNK